MVKNSFVPAFFYRRGVQLFLGAMITYFLVNITWVFFRADSFEGAWRLLSAMFGFAENGTALLPTLDLLKVGVVTVLLIASHWFMRNTSVLDLAQRTKWWIIGIGWAFMLILLVLSQKSSDSFIYFQF